MKNTIIKGSAGKMIPKFKVWDKHNEQMIEWVDLDF